MLDLDLMLRIYPFFLQAAWVTIQLSILTTILGLICGSLGAAARLSRHGYLRMIGATYVSLFRGTPALIQLFLLYFGGPQVGIQLDAFEAGVIGLGVNIGAYMTETMRGSIIAIDKGQAEAARTLGLSSYQAFRNVVLPQALRLMIRPLGVNINALIKGTALVAAISVVELTYTAQRYIGSTYKPFEMFLLSGLLYMVIIYVVGKGISYLDRKVRLT
ncbi:amino acid ABC transporter permease [Tropicimonas sp. TH_r6]|uniref:amino acid ABC transporter permease n=1 Tax=Tropicimonas sp. TH_r6 TaxID=3082085 RepID=UPI002954C667|nr:amino acid ABC transporter permease [Tropicimonas sp. TH_r6]MDV7144887.1 amino acid ABC transporter permease [Tropicimonas sp. TH_r6]